MSVLHRAAPLEPCTATFPRRLEVAWSFAARVRDASDPRGTGRLVLLVERSARVDDGSSPLRLDAWVELGHRRETVLEAGSATGEFAVRAPFRHLRVLIDGAPTLEAILRDDRAIYVRSTLPAAVGLPGGSYDAPCVEWE